MTWALEIASVFLARWVTSGVLAAFSGIAVCAVLISSGQSGTLAAEVQSRLDSPEARTIVVRGVPSDGMSAQALRGLAPVDGIDWVIATGPSQDVTNAAIEGGSAVGMRRLWSTDWRAFGIAPPPGTSDLIAWSDPESVRALGIDRFPAQVRTRNGTATLLGTFSPPRGVEQQIRGLVIPTSLDEDVPVTTIAVEARSAAGVPALVSTIRAVLPASAKRVTISTNRELAVASESVRASLDVYGRRLLVGTFGGAGIVMSALQVALVLMNRRDFGRRRALGASRHLVGALVVGHTALSTALGAVLGSTISLVVLRVVGWTSPRGDLVAALDILLVTTACLAALLPASMAARLDPAREMRVA